METANILRIIVGVTGGVLLWADFITLARRKMKEAIGMCWCIFGILLIALATVPGLTGWSKVIPTETVAAVVLLGVMLLWLLFTLSRHVSTLMMKNQELAMQVSLLNQENERILCQLEMKTGKRKVDL